MAAHSSILVWRIPWLEEPGGLSPWGHKESDTIEGLTHYTAAKSLQSCPTLCNPLDSSPSGSAVPGILQARILEWATHYTRLVLILANHQNHRRADKKNPSSEITGTPYNGEALYSL